MAQMGNELQKTCQAGGAHWVDCLPSMSEASGSSPRNTSTSWYWCMALIQHLNEG